MIRPIWDQIYQRNGRMNEDLLRASEWWIGVLVLGVSEERPWTQATQSDFHLFCDAAGNPPHLGAVLLRGEQVHWAHMAPPEKVMHQFKCRKDNQIMALELLAIAMAICTFEKEFHGANVVIYCDNTGSEVSLLCVSTCVIQ